MISNNNESLNVLYDKLFKFKNQNSISKTDVISLLAIIIFEKDIFKRNKDIKEFIEEVFNIKYRDYVIASRTMIFARLSRDVYKMDDNKLKEKIINLLSFFYTPSTKPKNNKKKNENDKLDTWLKRL